LENDSYKQNSKPYLNKLEWLALAESLLDTDLPALRNRSNFNSNTRVYVSTEDLETLVKAIAEILEDDDIDNLWDLKERAEEEIKKFRKEVLQQQI